MIIEHDADCKWWPRWYRKGHVVCDCPARTGFRLEARMAPPDVLRILALFGIGWSIPMLMISSYILLVVVLR